jgi:hypothetical protein
MGAQTDRERRAYDDLHGWMQSEAASVRALEDENTASETPEGGGGGQSIGASGSAGINCD